MEEPVNNLNSILVEGVAEEKKPPATVEGKAETRFYIVTKRYYEDGGEIIRVEDHFQVNASGKLADEVSKQWRAGRKMRVVGRLRNLNGAVFIEAEHVEWTGEANDE
jgi:hypothetical protein